MDNQTQMDKTPKLQPLNISIENEQYLTTPLRIETYPHQLISVGTNSRIGIKYIFEIPSNTTYYLNISGKKTSQQNVSILLNETIENSNEQLYYSSNTLFKIYNSSYSEIIKKKNINFNLTVYIYIDKPLPKSGFIINSINLILNNGLIVSNVSSKTYKPHTNTHTPIYNVANSINSNNMTIKYTPEIPLPNNKTILNKPMLNQTSNSRNIDLKSDNIQKYPQNNTEKVNTEQVNTEQVNMEQVNTEQVNTEQVNTEQVNIKQSDDEINYLDIQNKLLEFSKKIDEDLSKEDTTDDNIISDLVSKINKLSEINTEIETNYSKLIKKQTDKIQKLNICIGLDNINDFDNSMSQSYDQYPSME